MGRCLTFHNAIYHKLSACVIASPLMNRLADSYIVLPCIYIYIYIYCIIVEKSPNSGHMYDHGFMDNSNRQAVKNWLNSQTSDASLTSWRQPFCNLQNGCLHDVRCLVMKSFEDDQQCFEFNPVFDWKPEKRYECGSYAIIFPQIEN